MKRISGVLLAMFLLPQLCQASLVQSQWRVYSYQMVNYAVTQVYLYDSANIRRSGNQVSLYAIWLRGPALNEYKAYLDSHKGASVSEAVEHLSDRGPVFWETVDCYNDTFMLAGDQEWTKIPPGTVVADLERYACAEAKQ